MLRFRLTPAFLEISPALEKISPQLKSRCCYSCQSFRFPIVPNRARRNPEKSITQKTQQLLRDRELADIVLVMSNKPSDCKPASNTAHNGLLKIVIFCVPQNANGFETGLILAAEGKEQ
jgi:hypothetical protein